MTLAQPLLPAALLDLADADGQLDSWTEVWVDQVRNSSLGLQMSMNLLESQQQRTDEKCLKGERQKMVQKYVIEGFLNTFNRSNSISCKVWTFVKKSTKNKTAEKDVVYIYILFIYTIFLVLHI